MALEQMFALQKKLNDETNGANWELGFNKFDKEINWLRCIHMEVAELIDSTPWKHWKNIGSSCDVTNIKVELVDIWHFVMSFLLQEKNIPKCVALVGEALNYQECKDVDYKNIIAESEKLSFQALSIQMSDDVTNEAMATLVKQFFKCCEVSGLSSAWLSKLYIGKNCLNKFRQDHGYKEGTYIKTWNGEEDNVHMVDILEKSDDVSFDEVYEKLEAIYKTL
jgi:dimeric dUTPase (all-alpha-NTP-PPase superfamily)